MKRKDVTERGEDAKHARTEIDGSERVERARRAREHVMLLDIDECSMAGQDLHDIPGVMQVLCPAVPRRRAPAGLFSARTRSKEAAMQEAVQLLVNPALRPTFLAWTDALGYAPAVVLYTHKGGLVDMARELEAHPAGGAELVLRGGMRSEDAQYLARRLAGSPPRGTFNAFERLGWTSHAIAAELGLEYTPAIIVTQRPKSTLIAGACLGGYPPSLLHLYDDRAADHARDSGAPLDGDALLPVEPFRWPGLFTERARRIAELVRKFPIPQSAVLARLLHVYTASGEDGGCVVGEDPAHPGCVQWTLGGGGHADGAAPHGWALPTRLPHVQPPGAFKG